MESSPQAEVKYRDFFRCYFCGRAYRTDRSVKAPYDRPCKACRKEKSIPIPSRFRDHLGKVGLCKPLPPAS